MHTAQAHLRFEKKSSTARAEQMLTGDHETMKYLGEIESACDQMERMLDFATTYDKLGARADFITNLNVLQGASALTCRDPSRIFLRRKL